MKIKNKEILDFATLTLGEKHLPVKVAFAISMNAAAVDGALKSFDEQKRELLERYGKKDETGKLVVKKNNMVEIEDAEGWDEDYGELLEAEAEVAITTIKMKDLMKCDEAAFDSLSLAEIALMRFMIEV